VTTYAKSEPGTPEWLNAGTYIHSEHRGYTERHRVFLIPLGFSVSSLRSLCINSQAGNAGMGEGRIVFTQRDTEHAQSVTEFLIRFEFLCVFFEVFVYKFAARERRYG